jgi:CheY-like chemotaxis protein
LIIEDEPLIAGFIQQLLEEEGATSFDIAATENEAVAAALARPPQLITSDVRLLDGAGPAAVENIVAELGCIPVIFITSAPEECGKCQAPAIVLRKPVTSAQISRAFRSLSPLKRSEHQPETAVAKPVLGDSR